MMKIAVISDIHANMAAFEKVLEDIEANAIDEIICLGDCIGYGPEPEQVVSEIRRRQIPTIIGNHELAAFKKNHLDWFNPLARNSLEKSISLLSRESLDFIQHLPYCLVSEACRYVHGYPPKSARTYLFQKAPFQLVKTFNNMAERICFVGHTHDLEIIQFDGRQVERWPLSEGERQLDPTFHYIINVGSVGQPRDGNNHAKYLIFVPDRNLIDVRFVAYDIAITVAKIKAAGMPEAHARRLW
jgi:predicted phosphodiesterase